MSCQLHRGFCLDSPFALLGLRYAYAQSIDLGFAAAEKVVGPQHVVDGRDEIFVTVCTCEVPRKCGKETSLSVGIGHHEHAEHLAPLQLFAPILTRGEVTLHLGRRLEAQRVWHVMKGPREESGQCYAADIILESVQHIAKIHIKAWSRGRLQ